MGTYHKNLSDDAVIARVKVAIKTEKEEICFSVPKAEKNFLIKIYKGNTSPGIFEFPGEENVFFSIEELNAKKMGT